MSVKVSSWVWHEARDKHGNEIAGNALILMLALADVADDNGRCRFVDDEQGLTYPALAEKVRVHPRTIVRAVADLLESGLIEVVKGRKGRPNEFQVLVPWLPRSGDNLAPNGVEAGSDSVTTGADSVTTDAVFGDNGDSHSSIERDRVTDVSTSATPLAAETVGQRFAQPLCDVLSTELVRLQVKHTVTKRWLDAARLLVDADGRDPREAKALIEWALHDSFWMQNIHSMPKFREKYDQLRLRMGNTSKGTIAGGRVAADILAERRAAREGAQKQVSA